MGKRTVLTEKEAAIDMWECIKELIRCTHSKNIPINIQQFKYTYIEESNMLLEWKNSCILCQKYANVCPKCPLSSCSIVHKTLWAIVTNNLSDFTLEERLDACDRIIEAIKKDVHDDYKS